MSSTVKKAFASLGGSSDPLQPVEGGQVKYALETSTTYPCLVWHSVAGGGTTAVAAAAEPAPAAPAAAKKVIEADAAELEEIVILGKEKPRCVAVCVNDTVPVLTGHGLIKSKLETLFRAGFFCGRIMDCRNVT